ncbi:Zn finger protein [Dimargaris xerosporica]|nr:Zn finger protein [Dimargaris xerosporica]
MPGATAHYGHLHHAAPQGAASMFKTKSALHLPALAEALPAAPTGHGPAAALMDATMLQCPPLQDRQPPRPPISRQPSRNPGGLPPAKPHARRPLALTTSPEGLPDLPSLPPLRPRLARYNSEPAEPPMPPLDSVVGQTFLFTPSVLPRRPVRRETSPCLTINGDDTPTTASLPKRTGGHCPSASTSSTASSSGSLSFDDPLPDIQLNTRQVQLTDYLKIMWYGDCLPRKHWKADKESDRCDNHLCLRGFNPIVRRHHCRLCGYIFCGTCTKYTIFLHPDLSFNPESGTPCRSCKYCYRRFLEES